MNLVIYKKSCPQNWGGLKIAGAKGCPTSRSGGRERSPKRPGVGADGVEPQRTLTCSRGLHPRLARACLRGRPSLCYLLHFRVLVCARG